MTRTSLHAAALLILLFFPATSQAAHGLERWTATSTTAMGITGDIALSPTQLVAAGKVIPLAVAADVTNFGSDQGPQAARILRVTKPTDPVLKNGNTLCGAPRHRTAVRWLAVYRSDSGRNLNLSVFSGDKQPRGESDPSLCGTFLYSR